VTKCNFPTNPPVSSPSHLTDGKTDIRSVSDPVFLEKATDNTLEIYQSILWNVEARYGPVIEVFEVEGTRERRLVIGYKMGGTTHFFSALSKLYHFYSLYSARKYVGASFTPFMLLTDRRTCARTILKWDHDYLDLP
jgi:glutamate dehydrogenase